MPKDDVTPAPVQPAPLIRVPFNIKDVYQGPDGHLYVKLPPRTLN